MNFASSNVLGIAVADRMIVCAELGGRGDARTVKRSAAFTVPPELSFDNPEELGKAFASFLKEKDFSSGRAVVGVPAKWLVAVEKDVPPAAREQVKAMLRMQAERLTLAESGEVVFDFAGQQIQTRGGKVLLVAMLGKQLERVKTTMEAAGLAVDSITSTALAVASAASAKINGDQPMVMLGRQGAEVVWQRQGAPKMLRHFSVATANGQSHPAMGPLGMELRRAVTLGAGGANGQSANGSASGDLLLLDGVGLNAGQVQELSERVGLKVRSGDGLALIGVQNPGRADASGEGSPQRYAAAVALAVVGSEKNLLPLNFIKSRLAPPPVRKFGRKTIWAVAALACVVIGIAALWISVNLDQRRLGSIQEQKAAIKTDLEAATAVKDKIDFSNFYFKARTPALECLREVTLMFHDDDPMWAVNFTVKESKEGKDMGKLEGQIEGKANNSVVPYELIDRMRGNSKFSSVASRSVSKLAQNSRQREDLFTFSVVFFFDPNPAPATQPGAAR